jgi:hypothetical protein
VRRGCERAPTRCRAARGARCSDARSGQAVARAGGLATLLGPFALRETCIHAVPVKVIAVSTFQDSEFPRPKKKERSGTGSKTNSYQFPKTGAGHPESRFRASPRILEPGQISRSRYRLAESNLRTSPCDLEIERQNTDSKFRDSSFCLRSCTLTSSKRSHRSSSDGV